jgi:hypothetical protein
MAECPIQTFSGITQARFNCLVLKAQATGITISGNAGTATKDGITLRWQFDPAAQTLDLQCTNSPFFIPCELINTKIHDMMNACP